MSDKLVFQIEKLMDLNAGDTARLSSIMEQVKQGKQLYSSDQIYLDTLISKYLFPAEPDDKDKSEYIKERYGDESLAILKNRLAKGEITPSEFDILKNKLTENDSVADVKKEIKHVEEKMDEIKENQNMNQMMQFNMKSESTALVLSIILGIFGLQGIGHLYVGKIGKGVAILILGFIIFAAGIVTFIFGGFVLLIIYFGIFFWQILCGYLASRVLSRLA